MLDTPHQRLTVPPRGLTDRIEQRAQDGQSYGFVLYDAQDLACVYRL
jgi:hypothetical protein